jgi:hypothetical protein
LGNKFGDPKLTYKGLQQAHETAWFLCEMLSRTYPPSQPITIESSIFSRTIDTRDAFVRAYLSREWDKEDNSNYIVHCTTSTLLNEYTR